MGCILYIDGITGSAHTRKSKGKSAVALREFVFVEGRSFFALWVCCEPITPFLLASLVL